MSKIYLFKDQEDFVKDFTDDNVINIIGTKGSGKTTSSLKYINDDNYIVVNLDGLFEAPEDAIRDSALSEVRNMLKEKYGSIKDDENFGNYYNDIINYVLGKNKKLLIEGNSISDLNPSLLKGKLIIKRTGAIKSFIRAVKRDYKNSYYMSKEKEKHKYFYKITRLHKVVKRRKKIFKEAKYFSKYIDNMRS